GHFDSEHAGENRDRRKESEEATEEPQDDFAPQWWLSLRRKELAIDVPDVDAIEEHLNAGHEGAQQNQQKRLEAREEPETAPDHEDDQGRVIDFTNVALSPSADTGIAGPEYVGDRSRQEVHDPELG